MDNKKEEDDQHPIFFTEHGEVHCLEDHQKRKKFVFLNPKSDKDHQETVAFLKTFTGLANYLGEAQRIAGENDVEQATRKDREETMLPPPAKKRRLLEEKTAMVAAILDENAIYTRELYEYGKETPIKVALIVNVFEENPYIWLKRFWYNPVDAQTGEPKWTPCFGAYRFSLHDNPHELHRFAKKCLIVDDYKKKARAQLIYQRSPNTKPQSPLTKLRRPNLSKTQLTLKTPQLLSSLQSLFDFEM